MAGRSRPGSAAIAIGSQRSSARGRGAGPVAGALEGASLDSAASQTSLVNNESLGFDQGAVFDNFAAHARCCRARPLICSGSERVPAAPVGGPRFHACHRRLSSFSMLHTTQHSSCLCCVANDASWQLV